MKKLIQIDYQEYEKYIQTIEQLRIQLQNYQK